MNRPAETGRDVATGRKWKLIRGRRRPALLAAGLLGCGIFAARYLAVSPVVWGILACAALILLFGPGRHRSAALFFATVGLWFCLGAFRYAGETQLLPPHHVSHFLGALEDTEIFGRVVDLPDRRQPLTNLTLAVWSLRQGAEVTAVSGRILVHVYDTARHFSYGDVVRFSGRLGEPHLARNPGGFDYRRHLLDRGIHGVVSVARHDRIQVYPDPSGAAFFNRIIIPVREHVLGVFRTYVPGVGGTLLAGYLLGETREMPDSLYDAYRRSGVLHLLAVSGSNVWLVLGLFWLVFRSLRFPRVLQTALLLAILVVFCFAARNEPSVVRAGLMAALVLVARLFDRRADLLNIVGVSAAVILLVSPRHLFLPGFQLSYAAVLGILILVPPLQQVVPSAGRRRITRWLVTLIGSSVAATAATAPLIAIHFGTIPTISVAANLVMVPLAGLVTNGALILVLVGSIWEAAARAIGAGVGMIAAWSIEIVGALEAVPLGQVRWPHPSVFGIANYLLVLCAVAAWRRRFHWIKIAVFYALVAAGVAAGAMVFSPPDPTGEVVFLDAGANPLAGIFLPDGTQSLVGSRGAYSPSTEQWVIEPYALYSGWTAEEVARDTLSPTADCAVGGVLTDSLSSVLNASAGVQGGIRHVRFVLNTESSPPCLASEFLAGPDMQVLVLYRSDPDLASHLARLLSVERLDVLAIASALPTARLSEVFRDIEIRNLIIFGIPPGISSDALHVAWARQLSAQRVWSTARHGGLRVCLTSPVTVIPTIP